MATETPGMNWCANGDLLRIISFKSCASRAQQTPDKPQRIKIIDFVCPVRFLPVNSLITFAIEVDSN